MSLSHQCFSLSQINFKKSLGMDLKKKSDSGRTPVVGTSEPFVERTGRHARVENGKVTNKQQRRQENVNVPAAARPLVHHSIQLLLYERSDTRSGNGFPPARSSDGPFTSKYYFGGISQVLICSIPIPS